MTVAPSAWGIRNTELSKRGYNVSVIYFNLTQKLTFFKLWFCNDFWIWLLENVQIRKKVGKWQKVKFIFGAFWKLSTEKSLRSDT